VVDLGFSYSRNIIFLGDFLFLTFFWQTFSMLYMIKSRTSEKIQGDPSFILSGAFVEKASNYI
jgi:hypothetical protein